MLGHFDPKTWWYLSRATGLVAWGLLTLSVVWGLLLSTRTLGKAATPAWLLDLHRHLGGLALAFVAVHLAGLALDDFVSFGWRDLFVPMASSWKPGPVAWGVVALYVLLAVEVTSLLQRRMPRRWWKRIHYLSFPLFALATVHMLTAGTDRHNVFVRWVPVIAITLVVFLTIVRVLAGRGAAARPAPAAVPTPRADPVLGDLMPVGAAPSRPSTVSDDDARARRAEMLAKARAARDARAAG